MFYRLNPSINLQQRAVFSLAASVPVVVGVGDFDALLTAGVTIDTTSGIQVTSWSDRVLNASATNTGANNTPFFDQYASNGYGGLRFFQGNGSFNVLLYNSSIYGLAQNVSGFTVMQVVTPDTHTANTQNFILSNGLANSSARIITGFGTNNSLYIGGRRLDGDAVYADVSANNTYTPGETFVMTHVFNFTGDGTNTQFSIYKNNNLVYGPATVSGLNSRSLGSGSTSNTASIYSALGGSTVGGGYAKYVQGELRCYRSALSGTTLSSTISTMMANYEISDLQVLVPSNYQAFQKNAAGIQNIPISGTYVGSPTAIEASFNGGAFQTIASSPTGGTFSGTLTNQPAGQGTLVVRYTNNTTVYCKRLRVSITDVFGIVGQSNQTDVLDSTYTLETQKTYTIAGGVMGPTVYNSRYALGKWSDCQHMQTYHVKLGEDYFNTHGYPCAFVMAAIGGTSSAKWQPNSTVLYGASGNSDNSLNNPQSQNDAYGIGLNLYTRAKNMINLATASTGVAFLLWHQGEADSGTSGTAQATYLTNITNIYSQFNTDFGCKVMPALLQQQRQSDNTTAISTTNTNGAIQTAWTTLTYVAPGVDMSGLSSDYRSVDNSAVHLLSDVNVAGVAAQWIKGCGIHLGYKPVMDYLTSVTTAIPMYSVNRRLRSAYTGPLINVRRGDNQTQDIYPDAYGNLDVNALLTFVQASTTALFATITTIYDQGTLQANLGSTSTTSSQQPTIVNYNTGTGYQVIYHPNTTIPYAQYNGSSTYLDMGSSGLGIFNNVTQAYVAFAGADTQNSGTTGSAPYNSTRTIVAANNGAGTARVSVQTANYNGTSTNSLMGTFRSTDANPSSNHITTSTSPIYTANVPFVFHTAINFLTQNVQLYFNNTVQTLNTNTMTSPAAATSATNSTTIRTGQNFTNSSQSPMHFNELILAPTILSATDRILLARSQGYYYKSATIA